MYLCQCVPNPIKSISLQGNHAAINILYSAGNSQHVAQYVLREIHFQATGKIYELQHLHGRRGHRSYGR
jgi:hypothetical protein